MTSPLVRLVAGRYEATVDPRGAALSSLTHSGRPLVLPREGSASSEFRGAVLVPWPNRILDASYRWAGTTYHPGANEPALGHALHGLVLDLSFTVAERGPSAVTLTGRLASGSGYGGDLDVTVRFRLDAYEGLRWEITSTNRSPAAVPYGAGFHPYLVAGPGRADDWLLSLPVVERLEVDAAFHPTGVTAVAPYQNTPLRGVSLDHAFRRDEPASYVARLLAPTGEGVELRADPRCRWVQVYTGDGPGLQRRGVAVEPQTAPPDAFSSGVDLVVLEPGSTHTAWSQIRAVSQAERAS